MRRDFSAQPARGPRAAQEKRGADQQQRGAGHLQHDERVARTAGARVAEHLTVDGTRDLDASGPQRRRKREQHGRDQPAGRGEA